MKYIDAEKLKAEIERRIEILKKAELDWSKQGDTETSLYYSGKSVALEEILVFINSLQQEQPSEICSKCIHYGKDDGYCYNPYGGMQSLINENGVYECTGFCEQEQPEVNLEKAAENYIAPIENDEGLDYINFNGRDIKDAFIAGAQWQKSQMLKDVVEGEIVKDITNKLAVTAKGINLDGFKFGQKVRIIIVKED